MKGSARRVCEKDPATSVGFWTGNETKCECKLRYVQCWLLHIYVKKSYFYSTAFLNTAEKRLTRESIETFLRWGFEKNSVFDI